MLGGVRHKAGTSLDRTMRASPPESRFERQNLNQRIRDGRIRKIVY